MGTQLLFKGAVLFFTGLLVACGGSGGDDGDGGNNQEAPVINSFQVTPGATQTGTPATFSWDVSDANGDTLSCTLDADGDGTVDHTYSDCGSTTTQAHTYNAAGNYTARLSVDDGNGGTATQTASITITANSSPVFDAALSAAPATVSAGGTVTLAWNISDADGDTLNCTLDADGDGNVDHTFSDCAGAGTQAHVYATAGTYTATLNVTDGNGGTVTSSTSITATAVAGNNPPFFTSALAVSPNPARVGDSVSFGWQVGDADGDTLTCTLDADGDGTVDHTYSDCASVTTQGHIYSTAGTYMATLNVSDSKGGSAQSSTGVSVTANIVPVFDSNLTATPNPIVAGDSLTFAWNVSDADGDMLACRLDVDGDNIIDYTINDCATATAQAHIYATAGEYAAMLTVDDGNGGVITQSFSVTVNAINTAPVIDAFGVAASPNFTNAVTTLTWSVSDAEVDTLVCSLDVDADGAADYTINDCANNSSQDHIFTTEGAHIVRLIVSDGQASSAPSEQNIEVRLPLAMDVTVDETPVVADERARITVTIGNRSRVAVDDVSLVHRVPSGLSFSSNGDAEPDVQRGNCGNTCTATAEATWTVGSLAAGESRTITINALVDAALLSGTMINMPFVLSATGMSPVSLDKAIEVYNTPSADLALSASTDPVMPGESFTFQVDVGNTSAASLVNGQLRVTLPAGVSVDAVSDSGTDLGNGEVSWDIASLAVGASLRRTISVTADSGLLAGEALAAAVELTHDGGQAIDNRAEHVVTVVAAATKLSVGIATSADPVVAGERVRYTLTLSNTAQVPVDNVAVQLRVPAELSFRYNVDAEPDAQRGNCGNTCTATAEATWAMGSLAAGESRTITINALVDAALLSGNLIATPIRITADGQADTMDRLHVLQVHNTPSADLALSASTDPVMPGESFTFQVDVGNTSAASLVNGQLRVTLPAGVSVDAVSDSGTDLGNGEVSWDIASLAVGASLRRTINVTADSGLLAGEALAAAVELTHDGGQAIDNRAQSVVTVTASAAPVSLTVSAAPDPVLSDGVLTYTITIANNSALQTDAVTVLFRVPDELSFHYSADAEPDARRGNCGNTCRATAEALFELGTIAASTTQVITINATVAAGLDIGTLIVAPVRVTATQLKETIDLQHVTVVGN